MHAELAAPRARVIYHLDRLSAALWIIVAVTLPFELKTPLVSIGPLSITNVELALYAVIAVWLARTIISRQFTWTPVHWAVLAWIAANVISAVLAPTLRGEAVKFALRSLAGVLLFCAATDWAHSTDRVRTIGLALGAGAVLSASVGIVEVIIPASVPVWLAFKTHVTVVGEVLRASGTFQYANTAAMYWEAALPIGLAAMISRERPLSRRGMIGLAGAVALVALAIVLSVSRAALVGTAIALLVLLVLERGALRRWAAFTLLLLIVVTAAQLFVSPVIASRFRAESERTWYLAQIEVAPGALTLRANAISSVPVTVTNTSARTWLADGSTPVRASYHWLSGAAQSSAAQDMIIFEGARTALPSDLEPGESTVINLRVMALPQPGDYHLQIDLVQEHVTWFGVRTGQVISVPVRVGGASVAAAPPPLTVTTDMVRPLPSQTRTELWGMAIELWRTWPVFGIGPDNFRWMYGTTVGATNFNRTVTANSWYVEALVNTGLIGAGCLIALWLTLLRAAHRTRRDRLIAERVLLAGLIAALAAFAVHGVVDYFLPFTPTYGLFWLAAGLLTGRAWSRA